MIKKTPLLTFFALIVSLYLPASLFAAPAIVLEGPLGGKAYLGLPEKVVPNAWV